MTQAQYCPGCGSRLAQDVAPEGLCPRCLLMRALGKPEGDSSEAPTVAAPGDGAQRATIGPYKLLHQIGEGGMGVVFLAEQQTPIRRRVALKLIKPGMDTAAVLARFESERQALALMDHPNIATVFDGGATPEGRPYFAMEYVDGIPITDYCDENRLDTHSRLELFMSVCAAVQHAHQKAVIHRDLKPSNVLVTTLDGKPLAKIIDFGVAKAIAQPLTERTVFTETGQLIGTPEYMSPEQAQLTGIDIDTRTDVYSLGVMLYELLVGARPFDSEELRSRGYDEIRRSIREDQPPKPSTRASSLGDESGAAARNRQTNHTTHVKRLRGDLDWITMKAIEKDRARRYGSPTDLSADIRRHLEREPVAAGPPGTWYRSQRFMSRHRLGVAAAAGLTALLLGFSAVTAVQAGRIARERDRANEEAATAQEVSDFLVELFELSNPLSFRGKKKTRTARETLSRGAERIEEELADQPYTQATLAYAIANVYRNMGLYDETLLLLEMALDGIQRSEGADALEVSYLHNELAMAYSNLEQPERAEAFFLEAIDGVRQNGGSDDPMVAGILLNLGAQLGQAEGREDEGEAFLLEAMELIEAAGEDFDVSRSLAATNLADIYRRQGRYEEAEKVLRESLIALERGGEQDVFDDDFPMISMILTNLGFVYSEQARYAEAEEHFRRSTAEAQREIGPIHPFLSSSLFGLAVVLKLQGEHERSVPVYEHALRLYEPSRSGDTFLAKMLRGYVEVLRETGRDPSAEEVEKRLAALETPPDL